MEENVVILSCRHCNQKNRIDKHKALYETDSIKCGKCRKNIFLELDEKLDFFNIADYVHPLDTKTLKAIEKIPAVTSILKFLVKNTSEQFYKILHYQNYIKVSEEQFPELYQLYKKMVFVLDLTDNEPELFVYNSPFINAYTYGVDKHFIGISTMALAELDDMQIMDILAHELGHVLLGHVLYKMAAVLIAELSVSIANKTFGLGGMLLTPIRQALLAWNRASELSADRVALMATKNLKAAHFTTLKLSATVPGWDNSKYNYEAFLEQGEIARKMEDENILVKIFNLFQNTSITHPFPVWRTGELDKWAKEGDYLGLLSKNHIKERGVINELQICKKCHEKYSVRLAVCPYCGHTDKEEDNSFFEKLKNLF